MAGLALVLRNLKTASERTIVTFADGAFYAMGIKPGDYELTLDSRVAERRGIVSAPGRVTVAAEADGASWADWSFVSLERWCREIWRGDGFIGILAQWQVPVPYRSDP